MSLSRRDLLKLGAGTGLTAAVGGLNPVLGQRPQQALQMKTIPSSGQRVPAIGIGIGCRNYRGQPGSAELPVFRDTFAMFHRLGGRVVDTSPNYGNSEQVIGEIMRELEIRDDLWLATKVGIMRNHDLDFVQVDFALGNRGAGERWRETSTRRRGPRSSSSSSWHSRAP